MRVSDIFWLLSELTGFFKDVMILAMMVVGSACLINLSEFLEALTKRARK